MRRVDVRALHKPLQDAGLVPPNCRLMSLSVGTSGGLAVVYVVFLDSEQLERLGSVFVDVAKRIDPTKEESPYDDRRA